jgi:tRNA 5-methylaminomethyl-2-thiouridine biosynthesis bifunctional protein
MRPGLADRGWEVMLLDRRSGPAMEASGNPAGLLRPVFSLDWNLHSRVTVASYFYGLRHLEALAESGFPVVKGEGGVLQLARDRENFAKQRRIVEKFSLPEELVRLVDTAQAGALAGMPVGGPGWWFPRAVWASPASICQANLSAGGRRVDFRTGTDVALLRRGADGWAPCDRAGRAIAEAPTLILANARSATGFTQAQWLPLRDVRGQISLLPEIAGLSPQLAIAREGYITPALEAGHSAQFQ